MPASKALDECPAEFPALHIAQIPARSQLIASILAWVLPRPFHARPYAWLGHRPIQMPPVTLV
eukprot:364133-Chlamydomonas_euryale.AAC.5